MTFAMLVQCSTNSFMKHTVGGRSICWAPVKDALNEINVYFNCGLYMKWRSDPSTLLGNLVIVSNEI